MSTDPITDTILVYVGPPQPDYSEFEHRGVGGRSVEIPQFKPVQLTELHGQVNIFLQQLNQVMTDTPEQVGGFRLNEIEVNAGIVVEASGGIRLAFIMIPKNWTTC